MRLALTPAIVLPKAPQNSFPAFAVGLIDRIDHTQSYVLAFSHTIFIK